MRKFYKLYILLKKKKKENIFYLITLLFCWYTIVYITFAALLLIPLSGFMRVCYLIIIEASSCYISTLPEIKEVLSPIEVSQITSGDVNPPKVHVTKRDWRCYKMLFGAIIWLIGLYVSAYLRREFSELRNSSAEVDSNLDPDEEIMRVMHDVNEIALGRMATCKLDIENEGFDPSIPDWWDSADLDEFDPSIPDWWGTESDSGSEFDFFPD